MSMTTIAFIVICLQAVSALSVTQKVTATYYRKLLATIVTSSSLFGGVGIARADDSAKEGVDYGLVNSRLLKCKQKSNCISTSSINSVDKYSLPWEFEEKSADDEFAAIVAAIKSNNYMKIATEDAEKHYVRAVAKSAVPPTGTDDIEFLVNGADKIITYRSNSRQVVSAGTGIIGDGGSNRNRLNAIQSKIRAKSMRQASEFENEYSSRKADNLNFIYENFNIQAAAQEPSEINFIG